MNPAPQIRALVTLACALALTLGTVLRAATPQDFGYGAKTLNGTPVGGHLPLLVVTFELSTSANPAVTRQPIESNINAIIDSRVFNFLVFPCVNGFMLENSHGIFSWARADVIGPVRLSSAETLTLDGQKSVDSGDGVQRTGLDCGAGIAYLLGLVAAKTGYNFAQWDSNHDGSVNQEELTIMLVGNNGETSGANRVIGAKGAGLAIPGQNVTLRGRAASLDHHTSFMTMTHELSHSLGTVDLYNTGCWDSGLTLMSCTLYPGNPDDLRTFDLDPWHKIQFGWVVPRIFTLGSGGVATVSVPQYSSPNTPIILYDPARGFGEYFIVEFRNNQVSGGAGYDANLTDTGGAPFTGAASGMALWHVSACPPGQASNCPPVFFESASPTNFIPGGTVLWNQSTPPLRWSDGSVTATRLNPLSISSDGRDLQFEWLTASDTWVDFSYPDGIFFPERGTFTEPFNTLGEGVVAASRGGTIRIKGGVTGEKPTIVKPLSIEAYGAPVTIGQ